MPVVVLVLVLVGGQQGRAAQAGRLAGRRAGSNATLRLEVRVRASCAMIRAPSERRARQRGSLRNTPKAARAGRVGRVVGGLGPVVFQRARRGRDEVPARCFGGRQAAQRASRRRGANGEGDEKERASPLRLIRGQRAGARCCCEEGANRDVQSAVAPSRAIPFGPSAPARPQPSPQPHRDQLITTAAGLETAQL